MNEVFKIKDKQNIIDVAILKSGTIDGVFDIIRENNLNCEPVPIGAEIIIPVFSVENKKVVQYFIENKIDIATDSSESDTDNWILADGIWNDNGEWQDFQKWNDN